MNSDLSDYKKKRKFSSTPEPRSGKPGSGPLIFVIHEHHARRLHYDLRLELNGVLKSWAVPKGPPTSPEEKRLAVHVEDHPLEYATFKGTIPEGNYGAGEVLIWDSGFYSSPQSADRDESQRILNGEYEKGRMHILLAGKKLKGLYTLIRTKEDQWLFMAKKDLGGTKKTIAKNGAEHRDPMPRDIKPMLADSLEKPFDSKNWLFEIKWDGYRAIAEIGKETRLYSRNGKSFMEQFPPVASALKEIEQECVLDGEIIALNESGHSEFQLLQDYGISPAPLKYMVFDLLYLNGEDLRDRPLEDRKSLLKTVLPKHSDTLLFSEHIEEKGTAMFEAAKKQGLEGIMAKRKDSTYESNRSDSWFKIKAVKRQEMVIAGFTKPRGSRSLFGALILGIYKEGKLVYAGHLGTGFNEDTLKDLHSRMKNLITKKSPFEKEPKTNMPVTWIKPELVAEVKFNEWTKEGIVRHPVYLGLREDKKPEEVVIENGIDDITSGHSRDDQKQIASEKHIDKNFSNLEKIYWPDEGYTKGDLIEYYDKISHIILPYLKDRPESLLRHPNGIKKQSFFQKNFDNKDVPSFAQTIRVSSEHAGSTNFIICNNKDTLLYMANLGCIELNPWSSRIHALENPDFMIMDLDPPEGRSFDDVVKVALAVRAILERACEISFIKTSGKRGLHILVPMGAKYSYETIRLFCELLMKLVNAELPELTTMERSPKKREGKIYLDHLQNRRGQTISAPYCLRPWPGAPVSTPLEWSEVKPGLYPGKFNIQTIWKRLEEKGDLWKDLLRKAIDLEESIRCLKEEIAK